MTSDRSRPMRARILALALVTSSTFAGLGAATAVASTHANGVTSVSSQDVDPVDDDTIAVLGEYEVQGNEILGDAPAKHLAVWQRFAALFPPETRPEVQLFVPINKRKSDGTDGAMQLFAGETDIYYIALDATAKKVTFELDRTMIHEFGHLVTLRASQVPYAPETIDTCDTFTLDGGCPIAGAYLRAFSDQFWPGYRVADLDAEGKNAAYKRYKKDKTAFVTEYAATSPTEDIAEAFAEWVEHDTAFTGDSIAEQKLRFFDAYPELVALREQIKTALGESYYSEFRPKAG